MAPHHLNGIAQPSGVAALAAKRHRKLARDNVPGERDHHHPSRSDDGTAHPPSRLILRHPGYTALKNIPLPLAMRESVEPFSTPSSKAGLWLGAFGMISKDSFPLRTDTLGTGSCLRHHLKQVVLSMLLVAVHLPILFATIIQYIIMHLFMALWIA
jgi:hypothetical protein